MFEALGRLRARTFISTEADVGHFDGQDVVKLGKKLQEWNKEIHASAAQVPKVSYFTGRPSRFPAPDSEASLRQLLNSSHLPSLAEISAVFPWLDPNAELPPFPDPVTTTTTTTATTTTATCLMNFSFFSLPDLVSNRSSRPPSPLRRGPSTLLPQTNLYFS